MTRYLVLVGQAVFASVSLAIVLIATRRAVAMLAPILWRASLGVDTTQLRTAPAPCRHTILSANARGTRTTVPWRAFAGNRTRALSSVQWTKSRVEAPPKRCCS